MKYLGNYKSLIQPNVIEHILNNKGEQRPGAEEAESSKKQYDILTQTNAKFEGAHWSFYYNEVGIETLILPIEYTGSVKWWFVKLNPACVFPMHTDTFSDDSATVRRLWIPCQDYISGHVFIYKDTLIKDYRAGDIFEFDDAMAQHGSSNMSVIPKISLQVAIQN